MVNTLQQPKKQHTKREIVYPESDGKPMADNTKQFRCIVTIEGGTESLFADDPDVFVAGDLFWYPIKGNIRINAAPDAMVVFGRPKGDRGSYRQWEEGNIAPQVVFEIISPCNTPAEMRAKLVFYEKYGVEECYYYDPDHGVSQGWVREGERLVPVPNMEGHVSPRLGVRFGLEGLDLVLWYPDGRRFQSYGEMDAQRRQEYYARRSAEAQADEEHEARRRAEALQYQAEQEREQEHLARQQAEAKAEQESLARQQAEAKVAKAETEKEQEQQARQQAEAEREQERLARQEAEQRTALLEARLRELGLLEA